jgi:hypothetical protein
VETIQGSEAGAPHENRAVRFVDISGLGNEADGWTPVYLVYSGLGQAGIIELERITMYYKFTPLDRGLRDLVLGDFSIDVLKRRVGQWLEPRNDV